MAAERERQDSLRARVFEILEHGRRREPASRAIDWLLVVLVVANVVGHRGPHRARYRRPVTARPCSCSIASACWSLPSSMSLAYGSRPSTPCCSGYTPAGARLRFAATPLMVIDALALLPLLLELLFPRNELLLLTRLVRFLKLARYSPALATFGRLIASERRALLACVIIFTGVLLAAAAAMHVVEGAVQPDKLGDMPKAMWWAASMLAKIGGGELTPLTTLGRIIAAITVMLGIVCFALPVAIIGRGFYEEIRRRDFVVTFAMVARVPLFARLDAAAIAGLVGMLRARTVPAGTTIIRKGGRGRRHVLHRQRQGRGRIRPTARWCSRKAISSARSRFCRGSRARPPSPRCAPPTCWCSMPMISCVSSTGFPISAPRCRPLPRSAGSPRRRAAS